MTLFILLLIFYDLFVYHMILFILLINFIILYINLNKFKLKFKLGIIHLVQV